MTVNELVQKIAARLQELGDMPLPRLRAEYGSDDTLPKGLRHSSRGELLAAIIDVEFSSPYDSEIV